ncbi:MAG: ABC transporter ATP-binding protein [Candidatus Taylorbacteria bacterium]|nr:ABC transporter ATP-binding protein [Candidatus Taylorbacteria bacterium]
MSTTQEQSEYIIRTSGVRKSFVDGDKVTHVLKGIDLKIKKGEFVAIMGRSGAGKSTLLYQVSLLDHPTEGEIYVDGVRVTDMHEDERVSFRLKELGYVFQDYALLPDLTAKENVAVPLIMQGKQISEAYEIAERVLTRVGLGHRVNNLPSKLSGGEQQRVSIARAIAHEPKILFADEPTANLDSESSALVLKIFQELHALGQTIVMVTHEDEYGKATDRVIRLQDGQIIRE